MISGPGMKNNRQIRKKYFDILYHKESGEMMNSTKKSLLMAGAGLIGVVGILLLVKTWKHHAGLYEKVGKGIDEKMRESKAALERASAHVQQVFEHIKSIRPKP